jgi:poly(3-hydroxybutyrate) depolymerase
MNKPWVSRRIFVLFLMAAPLNGASMPVGAVSFGRSGVVQRKLEYGDYFEYVPRRAIAGILVVAHGSVIEEKTEQNVDKVAEAFARRWIGFADEHGLIVVAPVFGHSFGSWNGEPGVALGGYRALEGGEITADEFVHRIVDQYKDQIGGNDQFYLYGHSAGGQFANRYAVRHPERLKALILSAPGRYSFPDPKAPWPYGQKEVTARPRSGGPSRVITPDPDGWRKAAALPITVVVGSADTEPQPPRTDHAGSTRVDYARNWVDAMSQLAPEGKNRIRLIIVPGIGHSSSGLTPTCQKALAELI